MTYIVESNLNLRKVTVEGNDGEFAIISFDDSDSRLMVRSKRVYGTMEEACRHLPYGKSCSCGMQGITGMPPWDYPH